jgi:hypothetical protein
MHVSAAEHAKRETVAPDGVKFSQYNVNMAINKRMAGPWRAKREARCLQKMRGKVRGRERQGGTKREREGEIHI